MSRQEGSSSRRAPSSVVSDRTLRKRPTASAEPAVAARLTTRAKARKATVETVPDEDDAPAERAKNKFKAVAGPEREVHDKALEEVQALRDQIAQLQNDNYVLKVERDAHLQGVEKLAASLETEQNSLKAVSRSLEAATAKANAGPALVRRYHQKNEQLLAQLAACAAKIKKLEARVAQGDANLEDELAKAKAEQEEMLETQTAALKRDVENILAGKEKEVIEKDQQIRNLRRVQADAQDPRYAAGPSVQPASAPAQPPASAPAQPPDPVQPAPPAQPPVGDVDENMGEPDAETGSILDSSSRSSMDTESEIRVPTPRPPTAHARRYAHIPYKPRGRPQLRARWDDDEEPVPDDQGMQDVDDNDETNEDIDSRKRRVSQCFPGDSTMEEKEAFVSQLFDLMQDFGELRLGKKEGPSTRGGRKARSNNATTTLSAKLDVTRKWLSDLECHAWQELITDFWLHHNKMADNQGFLDYPAIVKYEDIEHVELRGAPWGTATIFYFGTKFLTTKWNGFYIEWLAEQLLEKRKKKKDNMKVIDVEVRGEDKTKDFVMMELYSKMRSCQSVWKSAQPRHGETVDKAKMRAQEAIAKHNRENTQHKRKVRKYEGREAYARETIEILLRNPETTANQAELWRQILAVIMKLGVDGMSSDSDGDVRTDDNIQRSYFVRALPWRAEICNEQMALVDHASGRSYDSDGEEVGGRNMGKRGPNITPRYRPTDRHYMEVKGLQYIRANEERNAEPVKGLPRSMYNAQWLNRKEMLHPGFTRSLEISRESFRMVELEILRREPQVERRR